MGKKVDIEAIKKKLILEEENKKQERFAMWNRLKPFICVDDIPDIPIIKDKEQYNEVVVNNLIRCGAIPKNKLVVGAKYKGTCRNFEEATWNGKQFVGMRYKFGEWIEDRINHFEDDNGFDLFVPLTVIENYKNSNMI